MGKGATPAGLFLLHWQFHRVFMIMCSTLQCLKSLATWLSLQEHVHGNIKENIKALYYWSSLYIYVCVPRCIYVCVCAETHQAPPFPFACRYAEGSCQDCLQMRLVKSNVWVMSHFNRSSVLPVWDNILTPVYDLFCWGESIFWPPYISTPGSMDIVTIFWPPHEIWPPPNST